MKIIITENQQTLLRRYHMIKDQVYKQMNTSNPCYYNDYFDFKKYKEDIINSSVNEVVGDFGIDERELESFKGKLLNNLIGIIRKYYNKYLKDNCNPRW